MVPRMNCQVFLVALLSYQSLFSVFVSASFPTLYREKRTIIGSDFFPAFNWETEDDPTHGRVNYIDSETARERGLAYSTCLFFFVKYRLSSEALFASIWV